MSDDDARLQAYVERLAKDPEFVAEVRELERKVEAGEDIGPTIDADEFRRRYIEDGPPPCPRCGKPMHKVPVPAEPGDDSWVWGHDCDA